MIVAGEIANNKTSLQVTYDTSTKKDMLVATFWKDAVGGGHIPKNWVDIEFDYANRGELLENLAQALGYKIEKVEL